MKYKIKTTKRKKSRIGLILILLTLSSLLTFSVGFVSKKVQKKTVELQEIKTALQVAKEEQQVLQTQIENFQGMREAFKKEIDELKKELEELKNKNPEMPEIAEEQEKKVAYLTFDDGPSPNTTKILDFLKANNIKATFFVLGNKKQTHIYKRIVDEGHTIAIHSNTHKYQEIYKDVNSFMTDINDLSKLIEESTGVKPTVMRFPGGSNNTISKKYGGEDIMEQVIPAVKAAGLSYFDWNVDSRDAAVSKQDKQVIIDSVLNGAKSVASKSENASAVILMHDAAAKTSTVEALPAIVEGLKKQGFVFKELTPQSDAIRFK
ncbi:polysaccharide deacetylase [Sporanaerobium hydrogeniformans]|uniref:Polysaccharide deacetylase n=1 Tax=Sporanaerobium hydrogeniformans TaxID=3072179 RepID=A0AC61DBX1_9FIRM|nr:polysaccharide deacetylase family protein [Sporanaerobium hydrogeniformans]PHV70759.1 polysaccharide deacetylase [Sporanaerobium hydrogeniformans]